MIALIDGDILVWRCASAAEETWYDIYYDGELVESFNKKKLADLYVGMDKQDFTIKTRYKPLSRSLAYAFLDNLIQNILKNTGCKEYKIFLGGKINYRKYIDPQYKANRKGLHKPIHSKHLREYLIKKYGAIEVEYIEADDAIAIEQIKLNSHGEDSIIASIDKDMKQIPGWHYNIVQEEKFYIDEFEAWKNLYRQVLTGDVADNIIGLRGIGPKKADKILESCKDKIGLGTTCINEYYKQIDDPFEKWVKFDKNYQLLYVLRSQEEADERQNWVEEIERVKEGKQEGADGESNGPA